MTSITAADPMIDVLTDAIASKRDTFAILDRAQKEAQADLQHLREARARLLAKAAGVECGQIYLIRDRVGSYRSRPGIVSAIQPCSCTDEGNDWRVEITFGERDHNGLRRTDGFRGDQWHTHIFGRVEPDEKLLAALTDKAAEKSSAA